MRGKRLRLRAGVRLAGAFLLICGVLGPAFAGEPAAADPLPIRRFGLFIGSNDGGPGRERLLYAASDCNALAQVMHEIGGLSTQDSVILVDPDVGTVQRQMAAIGERIARERSQARRVEFLLYYSGHSDEEALMLGDGRMRYGELRDAMSALGADLSIAVLDSCASGAFIRLKGGQRQAPFLVDESSAIQGQVYLTSSSESEASQESDTIGGSFFTHALVAALRGAADFSLDGKVTLHEAYQYASQETLARTENTQAGPQHPSFYINLNGTGEPVLTDLRSTSAALTMSEDIAGKVYIRSGEGSLVAEVRKTAGSPLTIALPPGSYTVSTYAAERSQEARVLLKEGKWSSIAKGDFRDSPRVATRSRGDDPASGEQTDEERARELVQSVDEMDIGDLLGELGKELGKKIQSKVQQTVQQAIDRTRVAPEGGSRGGTERVEPSEEPAEVSGGGEVVVTVPFSVGFVPGLSFPYSGEARKLVSVNAIIGVSHSIAGLEASGIMNITSHDVLGAQVAGIGNIANGDMTGLQGGGIFNVVEGRGYGVQSAGIFSIVHGGGRLVQASGVFNLVESALEGAQLAGVFNRAPLLNGVQAAGVMNLADGSARGAQLAGVFNYAVSLDGAQAAGVVNLADGTARGVQLAGVFNYAASLDGGQIGVVNVSGQARGFQIGVVNVASSLRGVPIGLVNVVADGLMLASVSWDDRGYTVLDLASGTGLYTGLAVGALLTGEGMLQAVSGHVGIGAHLSLGPFFLEADVGVRNVIGLPASGTFVPTDAIPFPALRARAGILLFGRVGGFLGYAVDVRVGAPGIPANTLAHTGRSTATVLGPYPVDLYPRFYGGICVGRQPR